MPACVKPRRLCPSTLQIPEAQIWDISAYEQRMRVRGAALHPQLGTKISSLRPVWSSLQCASTLTASCACLSLCHQGLAPAWQVMDSQAAARVAAAAAAVGAPESPTHLQAALSQLSSAGLEDKAAEQAEEDAAAAVAAGVPGLESGSGETPRSSGGSDGAASSEADAVTACSRLSQDLRDEEAATAIAGLALQQNGASEVAAAAGGTR